MILGKCFDIESAAALRRPQNAEVPASGLLRLAHVLHERLLDGLDPLLDLALF